MNRIEYKQLSELTQEFAGQEAANDRMQMAAVIDKVNALKSKISKPGDKLQKAIEKTCKNFEQRLHTANMIALKSIQKGIDQLSTGIKGVEKEALELKERQLAVLKD